MKELVSYVLEKFKHKKIKPSVLKRYLRMKYKVNFSKSTLDDRLSGFNESIDSKRDISNY
jgi:hypothetical protein